MSLCGDFRYHHCDSDCVCVCVVGTSGEELCREREREREVTEPQGQRPTLIRAPAAPGRRKTPRRGTLEADSSADHDLGGEG